MDYKVRYISKTDGDVCSVWTPAEDKEDAIRKIEREYWDVDYIVEVVPF